MSNPDGVPERKSLSSRPESLADTLTRIRREALERVTDQLSGRASVPDVPSVFGDIRRSVGKAVKERSESAGLPLTRSASLS